ncbi:MAG TPA: radical SAM protein [Desulfatiglandales bacterium]|nr:radical SAM protein [Desulfatiglandales bacterium]
MKAFGPVPSRRLGNSLGINNIPYKVCTYSCVYCQIGKTERFLCERQKFYEPNDLATEVAKKVSELKKRGTKIDYLSFVPDGEPTLDINLGKNIELLKPLGIKIAVITNGSLLDHKDVREDPQKADLVSLKIDAVNKKTWLRINRPDKSLDLKKIFDGMLKFSASFKGEIITETMLIKGINDNHEEIKGIAGFLALIKPAKSYISIPTRPTALKGILPADDQALNLCYQIFKENLPFVEYLISSGENDFGFTGNIEEDLLAITSVHPMREDAVREYLKKASADWKVITDLIDRGLLTEIKYQGKNFYLKKFSKKV